jgi:hypothetical protein
MEKSQEVTLPCHSERDLNLGSLALKNSVLVGCGGILC